LLNSAIAETLPGMGTGAVIDMQILAYHFTLVYCVGNSFKFLSRRLLVAPAGGGHAELRRAIDFPGLQDAHSRRRGAEHVEAGQE
jgi:hypothetical protein